MLDEFLCWWEHNTGPWWAMAMFFGTLVLLLVLLIWAIRWRYADREDQTPPANDPTEPSQQTRWQRELTDKSNNHKVG